MADRFPLIVDSSGTPAIKELVSGDVLDLTGSTIKAVSVDTTLDVTGASNLTGVLTTTATQVATGGITSGSDIISDTDSTDSLGSTGVRWLKGWFDSLTAGTLTAGSGSVTDSSGAISFGDENLTTTGIVTAAGISVFTDLDISGDIDVDGTTNLDVVDIDGAVDMASTLNVTGNITGTGFVSTGDMTFGDDDKAIFGAGSDLQIYHASATNDSIIDEAGTGNLSLQGTNVVIKTAGGSATQAEFFAGDANRFYYNNALKLATTANGIDVTGIATASTSAKITQVALTSTSNAVAWDAAAAANAYHLTTENTTFSAPSNAVEGAIISVELAQGATPRTIAWNTVFEFAASTAPTVTATASKTDIFSFRYNGSVWQEIGRVQNLAQT